MCILMYVVDNEQNSFSWFTKWIQIWNENNLLMAVVVFHCIDEHLKDKSSNLKTTMINLEFPYYIYNEFLQQSVVILKY